MWAQVISCRGWMVNWAHIWRSRQRPSKGGQYCEIYSVLFARMHNADYHSELGFATHFIPSRRIPILLDRLAGLESAHITVIDKTIEEFAAERQPEDAPTPLTGDTRVALDWAFRHNSVSKIVQDLEKLSAHQNPSVADWAKQTLDTLHLRSPTSLKVALKAIREGRRMTLLDALQMEVKIAGAFCVREHGV
jgi:3-hydroxyisobutyryl-CoA hydrolase